MDDQLPEARRGNGARSTTEEPSFELPLAKRTLPEGPALAAPDGPGRGTPADTVPPPPPGEDGRYDLSDPDLYLNRELTWLNFNYRVLAEAEDERTPLLERLKFVAIVSSNIDEFFMKRIGGLKQQVGAGVMTQTVDGRTPQEQIDESYAVIRDLEARKRAAYAKIVAELASRGIVIADCADLPEEARQRLRQHYVENVYPLVTPQATDPAHPFPFVSNLSLNLLVTLRLPDDTVPSMARVKVPVGVGTPRFLQLEGTGTFVPLESVMAANLDLLFPDMEIDTCEVFRVTRNANTELEEDEADDLLAMIETELRERRFAPVVRLAIGSGMDPVHKGMLAAELGLDEEADVFEKQGTLGLADLWELAVLDESELRDPPHHPVDHPWLVEDRSMFHIIRERRSILLQHPYESYTTSVERLLLEASQDPKVRAIKMTVYRTSEESKAVDYLIEAARNGKQVAVVVELKARFDEAANIRWASHLSSYGIHVTYGVVGLKTHCKAILIVRRDFDGLKRYVHLGTGNYHEGTARQYSDSGFLTCDPAIGEDVTELFNYLTTGYKPKRNYRKLLVAPKLMKPAILERIEREIERHSGDSPGLIQLKLNALEDADVTAALYRASQAGVRVDLLVRDTCRLRPGVPDLSENVRVVSIVGRFLEHSRIYYFRNGGDEEYFIGSADAMRRNLRSRVETLCPVEGPALQAELRRFLDLQLEDRRSAWDMHADGSYVQRHSDDPDVLGSQEQLIRWAEARHRDATRLKRRKPRGIRVN